MRKLNLSGASPDEAWGAWWKELQRLWEEEGLLAVSGGIRPGSGAADTRAVLRCLPREALDDLEPRSVLGLAGGCVRTGTPWRAEVELELA